MKSLTILFLVLSTSLASWGCQDSKNNDDPATPAIPDNVQPEANPRPGRALPRGNWGSPKIGIKINRSDADVFHACGMGWIDGAIRPDENGHFDNDGSIDRTPNPEGPRGWRTAKYTGTVNAEQTAMGLKITYTDDLGNPIVESYVLAKDIQGPAQNAACDRNTPPAEEGSGEDSGSSGGTGPHP